MTIDDLRRVVGSGPALDRVESHIVQNGSVIDLARSLAALESSLAFYEKELRDMRAFARQWGAPVHEVSGNEEEYAACAVAFRTAIAMVRDAIA